MKDPLRRRSAEETFEDHLRLAAEHRFEEDIERNVAPHCVILERRGIFRGRDGARQLARLLEEELPAAPYVYTLRLLEGRFGFLEWTAEAERTRVRDGADSFVIEDGWIVAQTIHYTVEPAPAIARDDDLDALTRDQLAAEVRRLRAGIREHRDASGHELCWHHPRLWGLLPERSDPQPTVPDWPQFMRGCIRYRQSLDLQLPSAPRTTREHSSDEGDR
jgi:hypothetical protein